MFERNATGVRGDEESRRKRPAWQKIQDATKLGASYLVISRPYYEEVILTLFPYYTMQYIFGLCLCLLILHTSFLYTIIVHIVVRSDFNILQQQQVAAMGKSEYQNLMNKLSVVSYKEKYNNLYLSNDIIPPPP